MTALPPDPLRPPLTDVDDGPYWQGFYRGTMSQPVWRRIAFTFAIAILAAFAVGLAAGSARAAPRSAATAIPAELRSAGSSGNPSLPSGAPWVGSPGGAPLPTQDPGELTSAAFGGQATWYCSSSSPCTRGYRPWDLVAAIDPELGIPKGARIRVDHDGRSVEVTVVDVCACGGSRIVDLTSGAFVYLASLSVGKIDVSIVVLGPEVTPPATDP